MILVWLFLLIEILFFFIIKTFTENQDFHATILLFLNIPLVLFALSRYGKRVYILLFVGFFLRLIFMYWDIYGHEIIPLPHSGIDSVGFYGSALNVAQDLSLLGEGIYGGLYAKISGFILFLGPTSRIIIQYINVLLGMSAILLVYKMMSQLKFGSKLKGILLTIMIFFPSGLIFSSILLREAIISFLVIFSFYYFLQWILKGEMKNVVISFLLIIVAATFHSGVISVILGYMFMLLFYKPSTQKFQSSIQTIFVFGVLLISFFYVGAIGMENIAVFDKFTGALSVNEDLYEVATGGQGGSVYLQNLQINNSLKLVLFAPIKILYFLVSPLPMNWRGGGDVIAFLSDSIFYLVLFFYPIINYRKMIKGDPLTIVLFIMLLSATFVFGIALNNAGTAMRHRYKLFYLIVLLFGLAIENSKKVLIKSNQDH